MEEVQKKPLDLKKNQIRFIKIFYLITVCAITVIGFLNNNNIYEILKFNLLSIILITILIFVAKEGNNELFHHSDQFVVFILSYLFSLGCMIGAYQYNLYYLWFLGPMIIAMIIDTKLGLNVHFLLTIIFCVSTEKTIDYLIYIFIIGTIGCILSKYILEPKKIGYAFIIFLSSNITLYVIMNQFMTHKVVSDNILFSIFSSILLFFILFIISRFYLQNWGKIHDTGNENIDKDVNNIIEKEKSQIDGRINNNFKEEVSEELIERVEYTTNVNSDELKNENIVRTNENSGKKNKSLEVTSEDLEELLNDNHELLLRLKEFSKKLYDRSTYISNISYRAAKKINANEILTKAGGMYSKIGRTVSKDYIIDGVNLLEEYHFPREVIDIVKQHNLKYENPKSKEAAIVMITDSIVASLDAIKGMKEKKYIATDKVILGIFSIRLSKSNLEESGLSKEEIEILKDFYLEEFGDFVKEKI